MALAHREMGSPAVASLIAHLLFWGLLLWGLLARDLRPRWALMFLLIWFLTPVGLSYVPYGPPLFPTVVAVLDIVLVFIVLKGDVRLT
jgi:uncharacterized membrane protein